MCLVLVRRDSLFVKEAESNVPPAPGRDLALESDAGLLGEQILRAVSGVSHGVRDDRAGSTGLHSTQV